MAGRIPQATPRTRKISARGLVYALVGREQPYDVYQFSGVRKFEKPNHNPFKGL